MKRLLFSSILIALAFTASASAQNNTTRFFTAFASETSAITIDATAGGVGFTASKIRSSSGQAEMTVFRVYCASTSPCPINYTIDGSTVTSTHGVNLNEGDVVTIYNYTNIAAFRAIRSGANSAKIDPIYLK